jgi:DNA-binding MarR family transcriptional regulator
MAKGKESSEIEGEVPGEMIAVGLERLARLMRAGEHSDGLNPAQWEALRYLARANRFSNSPGALTQYLGATKGTISQTVKALERKGFITKATREGEKRSVAIDLTDKGRQALAKDPWAQLAAAIQGLGGKTRRRLARGVRELLSQEVVRGGLASFGLCATCRFFREKGRDGDPRGPHFCMLLEQPLSEPDSQKICVEHEAAA